MTANNAESPQNKEGRLATTKLFLFRSSAFIGYVGLGAAILYYEKLMPTPFSAIGAAFLINGIGGIFVMVITWLSIGKINNKLDTLIEGQKKTDTSLKEIKTALTDGFKDTNTSLDEIKTALTDGLAEISTILKEMNGKLGSGGPPGQPPAS